MYVYRKNWRRAVLWGHDLETSIIIEKVFTVELGVNVESIIVKRNCEGQQHKPSHCQGSFKNSTFTQEQETRIKKTCQTAFTFANQIEEREILIVLFKMINCLFVTDK